MQVTLENINKPNPKHYKFELRNVPVIIDGEDIVNDANMTREQAAWYWSVGKRYFRLCKKHDDPTTDIKKIIQEAVFLLSSILGKEYKAHLLDADGNDLLNEKEEIAVFDKLNDLLNEQEKEFLKGRSISCVMIDGAKVLEAMVKGIQSRLGDEENEE